MPANTRRDTSRAWISAKSGANRRTLAVAQRSASRRPTHCRRLASRITHSECPARSSARAIERVVWVRALLFANTAMRMGAKDLMGADTALGCIDAAPVPAHRVHRAWLPARRRRHRALQRGVCEPAPRARPFAATVHLDP